MDINKIWQADGYGHANLDSLKEIQIARFIQACPHEAITVSRNFLVRISGIEVASHYARIIKARVTGDSTGNFLLLGKYGDFDCLIHIHTTGVVIDGKPISVWVNITSHRGVIQALHDSLEKAQPPAGRGRIKWWYSAGASVQSKEIEVETSTQVLRPEYYPHLGADPYQFMNDYLNSNECLLLLVGPPGTGKTTWLREFIGRHSLKAHVVYDQKLMGNDGILMNFLFGADDLMIFEDADKVLLPRVKDVGNDVMSKILNAGDGLVKLPKKKIIFTTNTYNRTKVDEALVRPGRCFKVVELERMTHEQATAACLAGGMNVPADTSKTYTLAELFNQR